MAACKSVGGGGEGNGGDGGGGEGNVMGLADVDAAATGETSRVGTRGGLLLLLRRIPPLPLPPPLGRRSKKSESSPK